MDAFRQAAIPTLAFILGITLLLLRWKTAGVLFVYFGTQAGFSLYMKAVLSTVTVAEGFNGIPAGFLVTAIQQAVTFAALTSGILALRCSPWRYTPQRLGSLQEVGALLILSLAFATNYGFNNVSLTFLAVSLNMIIRSCLPLVTTCFQCMVGRCVPQVAKGAANTSPAELALMVLGVLCAALATVAKSHGSQGSSEISHLLLGTTTAILSLIAASVFLVMAGLLTSSMKLSPLDTNFYASMPAAVFLLPAIFFIKHPVDWPLAEEGITDWRIFLYIIGKPRIIGLVLFSGLLAAGYNVLQFAVVQFLSPTHVAFAGNFNKAVTIALSIVLGMEELPGGPWRLVMLLAILGNLLSFTAFSVIRTRSTRAAEASHELGDDTDSSSCVQWWTTPIGQPGDRIQEKRHLQVDPEEEEHTALNECQAPTPKSVLTAEPPTLGQNSPRRLSLKTSPVKPSPGISETDGIGRAPQIVGARLTDFRGDRS